MTQVLDLCAGGLGQHLTARLLGWSTAAVVERDPWCLSIAEARVPGAQRFDDVRTFPAKRYAGIDGMLAGWPCQPHSDAGLQLGADDERDLLDGILRALRLVRPGFAFLENVPAVLRTDGGGYFRRLLDALARLGYDAEWGVLGARDAGTPHRRLRLWLLAYAGRGRLEEHAQLDGASHESGHRSSRRGHPLRRGGEGGEWATPNAGDAKQGATDRSLRRERLAAEGIRLQEHLAEQVLRSGEWATPLARDHRNGACNPGRRADRDCGGAPLTEQVGALLNPAWVAALMGWPLDWLDLDEPGTDWPAEDGRGWPAPRILDGPSPQWHWEPKRTVLPRVVRQRCAKVKALGNGWVPQAAALAFGRLAKRALTDLPARQEVLWN